MADMLNVSGYEAHIKLFDALSHPMRVKIAGVLAEGPKYVSELAKLMQMSRPLLYMHLKKLEEASLVSSHYEISETGKTMKFYGLKSFAIELTPGLLIRIGADVPLPPPKDS